MAKTIIIYAHATAEEAKKAAFDAGYSRNNLDWDEEWSRYRPVLEWQYQAGLKAATSEAKTNTSQ